MNSDFVMKHSAEFAQQVLALPDATAEERITTLWRMAFARPPAPTEIASLARYVGDANDASAWARACQVLMMTAEFRTLY
jgi:hypothetical protein